MAIFVIEYQELSLEFLRPGHNYIALVCDTLEDAIAEIDTFKDFTCLDIDRVLFDGNIDWQGDRRYLFTWITENERREKLQRSYIVRELKETKKVKEAIGCLEYLDKLKEPIY